MAVCSDYRCVVVEVSAKDFVGISLEGFYICWEMEFIASLSCLKYIVGLIGVDHTKRPAVLPAESPQLASVVFGGFVAEASNVVPGARVDGDATEIINGVSMAEDNIAIGIGVLLPRVHSVSVSVDEREVATLVDSTD